MPEQLYNGSLALRMWATVVCASLPARAAAPVRENDTLTLLYTRNLRAPDLIPQPVWSTDLLGPLSLRIQAASP